MAALAAAAFLAYGSLVPFEFEWRSVAEARARLLGSLAWPPFIDSRIDFVSNVLLAVPIAYFAAAALATDERSRFRRLAAAVAAVVACLFLAVGVEFAQVFFPIRTDSLSDVIAQAIGALAGVIGWFLFGQSLTAWLRDAVAERERPALAQRLLAAYLVVFVAAQWMPLDLTLNLGELAAKYRDGGVVLRPFSYPFDNRIDLAWDLFGDVVLNIPIGASATLLWTRGVNRRSLPLAVGVGLFAVSVIELGQVFVASRVADTTDVLTGGLGAVIGAVVAARVAGREPSAYPAAPRRLIHARLAALVWIAALCLYHWNPFDFTFDAERIAVGLRRLTAVPFYSYYVGTPFQAFTEMIRKGMLAVPLGVFLQLSWSRRLPASLRWLLSVGAGFAALGAIELGQVLLPTRMPDITDTLIGGTAAGIAAWVTDRMQTLGGPSRVAPVKTFAGTDAKAADLDARKRNRLGSSAPNAGMSSQLHDDLNDQTITR